MNGAPQSSIAFGRSRKNAKRTGIVSSIGRQPPAGFTPRSRYRFMSSVFIFCLDGSVVFRSLYRAWIAFISGCSSCILRIDTTLLWFNGKMAMLIRMVRMMIDQP